VRRTTPDGDGRLFAELKLRRVAILSNLDGALHEQVQLDDADWLQTVGAFREGFARSQLNLIEHVPLTVPYADLRLDGEDDARGLDLYRRLDGHREALERDVRDVDRTGGPDRAPQALDRIDDVQAVVHPEGVGYQRAGRMEVGHGQCWT
jgi:hypothetical protein